MNSVFDRTEMECTIKFPKKIIDTSFASQSFNVHLPGYQAPNLLPKPLSPGKHVDAGNCGVDSDDGRHADHLDGLLRHYIRAVCHT